MANKPDPLLAQAQALVQASLQPSIQNITRQQEQARQEAAARAQALQGFTSAYADELRNVSPQVQALYQRAGQDTTAAAAGFSQGFRDAMTGAENQANALLEQQGSPRRLESGAGAADVLFGAEGFIPGNTLASQGAAFASAASLLPATGLGRGQQLLMGQQAEERKRSQELTNALLEIEAKRPGVLAEMYAKLRQERRDEKALSINEQYLLNTQRKTGAEITGFDPVTGQPTYETVSDDAAARAARQKALREGRARGQAAKTAAFTAARKEANTRAQQIMKDAKDAQGGDLGDLPGVKPRKSLQPKVNYQQAYQDVWVSIGGDELLRYATKSGRAALRKQIDKIVRDALRVAGIKPVARVARGTRRRTDLGKPRGG